MSRIVWITVVVLLACLGCGRKKDTAAPIVEAAPAPKSPAGTPAIPAVAAAPAPASPVADPLLARLRDLLSRYLENDGQGGWRKDEKAATELEKLTTEETSQLWPLLKDQDVNVRRGAAVFLLGIFDPASSEQVAALAALLSDSDSMVRSRGLDAVRQFSAADKIATLPRLDALLDSTREDRVENRAAAARLHITTYPGRGGIPGPALSKAATTDPAPNVRSAARLALEHTGNPGDGLMMLTEGLGDTDPSVRLVVAARLRQLGPGAAFVSPRLAAALADTDSRIAEAVAEALIRIGAPAVEPLADQLSSPSVSARKLAIACLIKIGPAAKPAASRIEKCKSDSDPEVRKLAEAALARILAK